MLDRTLSPWWFALVVIGFAGAGYFKDGRFGAVEGAIVAVVLAHGALLEALREEREERRKQEAEKKGLVKLEPDEKSGGHIIRPA